MDVLAIIEVVYLGYICQRSPGILTNNTLVLRVPVDVSDGTEMAM